LKSSPFGFLKSSKAKNVKELLSSVGVGGAVAPIAGGALAAAAAGAAEEPAKEEKPMEEEKDESDEDMVRAS
jgi:large subunit ribosomal protein LP1